MSLDDLCAQTEKTFQAYKSTLLAVQENSSSETELSGGDAFAQLLTSTTYYAQFASLEEQLSEHGQELTKRATTLAQRAAYHKEEYFRIMVKEKKNNKRKYLRALNKDLVRTSKAYQKARKHIALARSGMEVSKDASVLAHALQQHYGAKSMRSHHQAIQELMKEYEGFLHYEPRKHTAKNKPIRERAC